jgi:hypothetical protein
MHSVARSLLLLLLLFSGTMVGQERGFGVGILLGEPSGISMKGWLSSSSAIDAAVAWSFRQDGTFHIHADYLLHAFDVIKAPEKIPLYYGIGGRLRTGRHEDAHFGLRMVVGVDYLFRDAPIDLFVEVAPILDLAPATEAEVNAGVGARFWFR